VTDKELKNLVYALREEKVFSGIKKDLEIGEKNQIEFKPSLYYN